MLHIQNDLKEKDAVNIEKANAEATERMMEARPVLVGLGKALDVIPGVRQNLLLHSGPSMVDVADAPLAALADVP